MDPRIKQLLAAFTRVNEPPADLPSFLRTLPSPGKLPSPWEAWTLIGLVRHHERQNWVADIIRSRLRGDPDELASISALGHPEEVPQSGPVPGLPEWEYFFHGRGCCITHKVDGDAIDVDFWDDTAEYFDTYFYANYLGSLRHPQPPEQRLRELHRSCRTVTIAITDLIAAGALQPLPGRDHHPFKLANEVISASDDIEQFCSGWLDPTRRVWHAALIGDWIAAHEAATPELAEITAPRAEQCRDFRRKRLHRDLGVEYKGADALRALAELKSPDLEQCVMKALQGPPSGLISAALEVIEEQSNPAWCKHIFSLLMRMNPAGPIPEPHIWVTSMKILLGHVHRTAEVLATLPRAGGTEIGEAVLLSLEHAPQLARPLIRKALLSEIPINRIQTAAILAVIDRPWSIRELLGALEACDDQERTGEARAALLESGDENAHKSVLAWEERNPHEKEMGSYLEIAGRRLGPFYTFGELSLKNMASTIRYEMDKVHDRAARLRGVVPHEG